MRPEIIAEFISKFGKAVELCAGYFYKIAYLLKEEGKILCVCDLNGEVEKIYTEKNIDFIRCDIRNPCEELINLCKKADVIYSIRPPMELWEDILKCAKVSKCNCIIRPMYLDSNPELKLKLINYKGEVFLVKVYL